ncbi:hypothetical protein CEXT_132531 [Caerostris extrusa]|uniref:Uncharacterized protein n=1 Tax=Caerostris extrusa TaxID=172846 RepID=A0AAV4Y9B9_CAEEX|nr:hypothetical protein CEXT_132531 [Caerostris extrusa]
MAILNTFTDLVSLPNLIIIGSCSWFIPQPPCILASVQRSRYLEVRFPEKPCSVLKIQTLSPSSSLPSQQSTPTSSLEDTAIWSTQGVSTSSRIQDAYGNNAFGYTIKDGLGATNSRSEVGDAHGNRKGSYTIADIDGRARRVDYVADGHEIQGPPSRPTSPEPPPAPRPQPSSPAPTPDPLWWCYRTRAALGLELLLDLVTEQVLGWSCLLMVAPLDWDMADSKQLHMTTIIKLSAQIEIPNMPLPTAASLSSSVDLTFKNS